MRFTYPRLAKNNFLLEDNIKKVKQTDPTALQKIAILSSAVYYCRLSVVGFDSIKGLG